MNPYKLEFIENLDVSNYVICVRGTGNWSRRFYESLSWGRIPIFIDTDCILPYDFAVDWKDYAVWINQRDIAHAPEIVAEFHARLSPNDFIRLQQKCRQIWEERLSRDGYFRHFHEHFGCFSGK